VVQTVKIRMEDLAKQQALAAAAAQAQSQLPAPATTAAVAVKLPPFWVDNAEVWFLQAEAQFAIAGVTSERTAFYHVLTTLLQHVVVSVIDVVWSAATALFTDLKNHLLGGYTQSKWTRMFQLIHHPGLGDQRPSQLMDKMLALLSAGTKPDEVFMGLYMDRLPVEMQAQLSLQDYESPRHLAAAADLIWDARGPMAGIPPAVNAVGRESRNRSRSPAPSGGDGKQRRRGATPGPGGERMLCFYHRRFGEKAHRCEPPCTWAGNRQSSQPPKYFYIAAGYPPHLPTGLNLWMFVFSRFWNSTECIAASDADPDDF
jgi:hypothetical protein